jgi:hypothetical protein
MKSMVRVGIIVLAFLVITSLLVPAVVQAAEPIKIGVIYPLTGGAAAGVASCGPALSLPSRLPTNRIPISR